MSRRALLATTLIIFGRNVPLFGALALSVRLESWPLWGRALLVSGGAVASAWLISATERYVDPGRTGFAWKDFALNAVVFTLSGVLLVWYVPQGSYGSDVAVGVGLAVLLVGVQYGVLGEAFFFDRLRAAVRYGVALAISGPLFLVGLRVTLGLPMATALLSVAAVTLALSPILAYFNYTAGVEAAPGSSNVH